MVRIQRFRYNPPIQRVAMNADGTQNNHAETAAMLARARKAAERRSAGSAAEGAARAAARMEEREESRRRAEEEEAARWEARRLAGIHAHMERAKAAVRVSRK